MMRPSMRTRAGANRGVSPSNPKCHGATLHPRSMSVSGADDPRRRREAEIRSIDLAIVAKVFRCVVPFHGLQDMARSRTASMVEDTTTTDHQAPCRRLQVLTHPVKTRRRSADAERTFLDAPLPTHGHIGRKHPLIGPRNPVERGFRRDIEIGSGSRPPDSASLSASSSPLSSSSGVIP